jgi:hypothetical protein
MIKNENGAHCETLQRRRVCIDQRIVIEAGDVCVKKNWDDMLMHIVPRYLVAS